MVLTICICRLHTAALKALVNRHNMSWYRTYGVRVTNILRRDDVEARRAAYEQHPQLLYSSHLELEQKSRKGDDDENALRISDLNKELLKELRAIETNPFDYPTFWMNEYEHFNEELWEPGVPHKNGTEDSHIPASKVPCNGCGAKLHCNKSQRPGFIPSEIFNGRTYQELQTIICQRCHFLKHYNIALDVEVTPESYIKTIAQIKDKFALAIVIVNLVDFPCSIWPGLVNLLGSGRPIFLVGNKVDLLPRDSTQHLQHVKECLTEEAIASGFNKLNIKHVALISAKTGFGVEELITQLHNIWRYKGDVYLMGCTNVGKSTLFNILLNSDYCRPEASKLVRSATTCAWPGTTMQMLRFPILRPSQIRIYERFRRLFSERARKAAIEKLRRHQATTMGLIEKATLVGNVGRTFLNPSSEVYDNFSMSSGVAPITTLNERSLESKEAKWCYDTPGVMHPDQITDLLTAEELQHMEHKQMIRPRALRLYEGTTLFVAGLARLDLLGSDESNWLKIVVFAALDLPLAIVRTCDADEFYANYIGTDILGIPNCSETAKRSHSWPGLTAASEIISITDGEAYDIVLSSAGWIGIPMNDEKLCKFRAWTPSARGIHIRKRTLIPFVENLIGKHIRNSFAYHLAKPFTFQKPKKSNKVKSV